MAKMNAKDYEILDFIYEQIKENGYPPTVREICAAVNLSSPATIHSRLAKLERAGFLIRQSLKNRSLKLNNYIPKKYEDDVTDSEYVSIPVYGKITAGVPITAVEQLECHFPLPASHVRNRELFMLRVSGESMINAGIFDGDYIIIQQQPVAENGDIVAALVDDTDATVKTFYKEDGHFRLQPENDTMEPIISDNVSIIGKVIGVYRLF